MFKMTQISFAALEMAYREKTIELVAEGFEFPQKIKIKTKKLPKLIIGFWDKL